MRGKRCRGVGGKVGAGDHVRNIFQRLFSIDEFFSPPPTHTPLFFSLSLPPPMLSGDYE